jgi:hypothetical protein
MAHRSIDSVVMIRIGWVWRLSAALRRDWVWINRPDRCCAPAGRRTRVPATAGPGPHGRAPSRPARQNRVRGRRRRQWLPVKRRRVERAGEARSHLGVRHNLAITCLSPCRSTRGLRRAVSVVAPNLHVWSPSGSRRSGAVARCRDTRRMASDRSNNRASVTARRARRIRDEHWPSLP